MFLDRMPAGHFLPSLGNVLPHERPVRPWLVDVDAACTQSAWQLQNIQQSQLPKKEKTLLRESESLRVHLSA
jgi:hypothetical protein